MEGSVQESSKKRARANDHFCIFTHLSEETNQLIRDTINAELRISDRKAGRLRTRKEAIACMEDDAGGMLNHLTESDTFAELT